MNNKIINNLKKELKNNKYTFIVLVGFILFIFIFFAIYSFLVPNSSSDVKYGDRLKGIEKVLPNEVQLSGVEKSLKEIDYVSNSYNSVDGKIVKFTITVKEGTTPEKAKELSAKVLEKFSESQVAYFDFEIFYINEKEDTAGFPII